MAASAPTLPGAAVAARAMLKELAGSLAEQLEVLNATEEEWTLVKVPVKKSKRVHGAGPETGQDLSGAAAAAFKAKIEQALEELAKPKKKNPIFYGELHDDRIREHLKRGGEALYPLGGFHGFTAVQSWMPTVCGPGAAKPADVSIKGCTLVISFAGHEIDIEVHAVAQAQSGLHPLYTVSGTIEEAIISKVLDGVEMDAAGMGKVVRDVGGVVPKASIGGGKAAVVYKATPAQLLGSTRIKKFSAAMLAKIGSSDEMQQRFGLETVHNTGLNQNLCQHVMALQSFLMIVGVIHKAHGGWAAEVFGSPAFLQAALLMKEAIKEWASSPFALAAEFEKIMSGIVTAYIPEVDATAKAREDAAANALKAQMTADQRQALLRATVAQAVLACMPAGDGHAKALAVFNAAPLWAEAVAAPFDAQNAIVKDALELLVVTLADADADIVGTGLGAVAAAFAQRVEKGFGADQRAGWGELEAAQDLLKAAGICNLAVIEPAFMPGQSPEKTHNTAALLCPQFDEALPTVLGVHRGGNHYDVVVGVDTACWREWSRLSPEEQVLTEALKRAFADKPSRPSAAAAGPCQNCKGQSKPHVTCPVCTLPVLDPSPKQVQHVRCGMKVEANKAVGATRGCILCTEALKPGVCETTVKCDACSLAGTKTEAAAEAARKKAADELKKAADMKAADEHAAKVAKALADAGKKEEEAKIAKAAAAALAAGRAAPRGAECSTCKTNFLPGKQGHKMCGACFDLHRKEANALEQAKQQEAERIAAEAAQFKVVTRTCTKCADRLPKSNKLGTCGKCLGQHQAAGAGSGGGGAQGRPQAPPKCTGCGKVDKPDKFDLCTGCFKASRMAGNASWSKELKEAFEASAKNHPFRTEADKMKHRALCGSALRSGVELAHILAHLKSRRKICVFGDKCKIGDECQRQHEASSAPAQQAKPTAADIAAGRAKAPQSREKIMEKAAKELIKVFKQEAAKGFALAAPNAAVAAVAAAPAPAPAIPAPTNQPLKLLLQKLMELV